MFNDIKVGYLSAISSIKRGNRKTSLFIVLVLGLIFMNLVFLPALVNGMMAFFVGFVQDYSYGDIVIEPSEGDKYIENADNVIRRIREINGVRDVTKRLLVGSSLNYENKAIGANILGVIPSSEEKVSKYSSIISRGEFLGDLSRDEIILGSILAGTSSVSQVYDSLDGVDVGSIISVTYSNGVTREYKVRGIHEGTAEMTDMVALVHYKELESVFGEEVENKASSILVRIENAGEEDKIKEKIIDVGIKERVYTWEEKSEVLIRQAMQSMGVLGLMSKLVGLIVGASLIFIIVYINTLNRKREIGILRAIGITPNSIKISYMFISLFYALLGILVGLIMFIIIALYLQANPLIFYETIELYPIINISDLLNNASIMILMSIFAGFIPAWLVTREDMLKAIWGR